MAPCDPADAGPVNGLVFEGYMNKSYAYISYNELNIISWIGNINKLATLNVWMDWYSSTLPHIIDTFND